MPAITAFCVNSNDARPLTSSTDDASGIRAALESPADDLVDGVVSADVFAHHKHRSVGVEQRRGVQAAGAGENLLRSAKLVGHCA